MTENLSQGLGLLLSGMLTVFIILGLVVLSGRLLILAVNAGQRERPRTSGPASRARTSPPPEIVAVLAAAVAVATEGEGRIKTIEKPTKS